MRASNIKHQKWVGRGAVCTVSGRVVEKPENEKPTFSSQLLKTME